MTMKIVFKLKANHRFVRWLAFNDILEGVCAVFLSHSIKTDARFY